MTNKKTSSTRKTARSRSEERQRTTKRAYHKTSGSGKAGGGKPAPKKPAPSKPAPRRPASRTPARSKPAARQSSAAGHQPVRQRLLNFIRGERRPAVSSPPPKSRPVARGTTQATVLPASPWTLDRKLDVAGVVLSFIGFITLLILLSSSRSAFASGWLSFLGRAFGWGSYALPVALVGVGLWLVLRRFERVPMVSVERVVGLVLLFGLLVTTLHFLLLPQNRQESFALANLGQGGGFLGASLIEMLRGSLGWGGAAVALLAWLMIGLALTLDRSVAELFAWANPLIERWQENFEDWWDSRHGRAEGEFQPLPRALQPIPAAAPQTALPVPSMAPGQARTWVLPSLEDILDQGEEIVHDDEIDRQRARVIEETLRSFGAPVNVVEINRGPTITQFGVEPDFVESRTGRTRVRVGKIAQLADDLALALSARAIRVQAPVPGKGYVGIEVPNDEISLVALRDVIESESFRRLKSPLRFALGQDVSGNAAAADLSAMPHMLVAGATGSGKSVCMNAIIACLLLNNTPDDLRLIMVDPKRVELTGYNGIPHLLAPVVVETERVVSALQWVLREMDMRYQKLAQVGSRNITEYNARADKKLPRLVVIIDELADLMMLAPDDTERSITRLAQLARATGIHLLIATQRPSVDVVTGLIKANIPARIAFAVAQGVDSRVILDQMGAERLLGRGDMLFQAPDAAAPLRLQGAYVSDSEINRLVGFWLSQAGTATSTSTATDGIVDGLPGGIPLKQIPLWDDMEDKDKDPFLDEAIDLSRRQGRASISMLQRRLRIGYSRASRIIETLQEKGIIGTEQNPLGFEILDYGPAAPPVDADN